jgi:hypothetical protein
LAGARERGRMAAAGRALYEQRFAVKRTIAALMESGRDA